MAESAAKRRRPGSRSPPRGKGDGKGKDDGKGREPGLWQDPIGPIPLFEKITWQWERVWKVFKGHSPTENFRSHNPRGVVV